MRKKKSFAVFFPPSNMNSTDNGTYIEEPQWFYGAMISHYVATFVIFGFDVLVRAIIIVLLLVLRKR
jgi:Regulator of G protein signaling domain